MQHILIHDKSVIQSFEMELLLLMLMLKGLTRYRLFVVVVAEILDDNVVFCTKISLVDLTFRRRHS
jgi:hypothetical protein